MLGFRLPEPIAIDGKIDRGIYEAYDQVEAAMKALAAWKSDLMKRLKVAVEEGVEVEEGLVCEWIAESVPIKASDWKYLVEHFYGEEEALALRKKFAIHLKQNPEYRESNKFVFGLVEEEVAAPGHDDPKEAEGVA